MKPRVIIIEGPDGSGKSTLADCLVQLTGFDETHLKAPENETAYALCARHLADTLTTKRDTIFDRFHISERVYGPVHRGKDTMGKFGLDTIENVLWTATRPVVVLCLPPWLTTYENWRKRRDAKGEMITDDEQYKAVYFEYCESIRLTSLPVIHYDYTRHNPELLMLHLRLMGLVL